MLRFSVVDLPQGFVLTRHWRDTPTGTKSSSGWRPTAVPGAFACLISRRWRLFRQPARAGRGTAARRKNVELRELALRDFEHRPVLGLYCQQHGQLMRLETALCRAGVEVYEADVRPPERYLMERFITAPVRFGGTPDDEGLLDAQMKPDPTTGQA
jgi:DNA polymerase-2